MSELSNDLLLDILKAQRENAATLGRIDQTVTDMKRANENEKSVSDARHAALEQRVRGLEKRNWKRTSFIGGALFVLEPIAHYVAKKLGWV